MREIVLPQNFFYNYSFYPDEECDWISAFKEVPEIDSVYFIKDARHLEFTEGWVNFLPAHAYFDELFSEEWIDKICFMQISIEDRTEKEKHWVFRAKALDVVRLCEVENRLQRSEGEAITGPLCAEFGDLFAAANDENNSVYSCGDYFLIQVGWGQTYSFMFVTKRERQRFILLLYSNEAAKTAFVANREMAEADQDIFEELIIRLRQ